MSEELKPCPFCGDKAVKVEQNGKFITECIRCPSSISIPMFSKKTSAIYWNTRHIPEGYALVRVDDINTACETLKTIAFRAKAPNLLTPEVVMWAESFRRHMRKASE